MNADEREASSLRGLQRAARRYIRVGGRAATPRTEALFAEAKRALHQAVERYAVALTQKEEARARRTGTR